MSNSLASLVTPPMQAPLPPRISSFSQSRAISINPISLVINECITITSAMRKNARWAQSGVSSILGAGADEHEDVGLIARLGLRAKRTRTSQDNPLMAGFAKLRADLSECRDISMFDTPSLFHPFLQVIRSSSITGSITSLAINAITKFFSYRIISLSSPRLPLAMQLLSSAITHCRFEASDTAQDEVVLLRILRLMEYMMCGIGGDLLSDESVCEMMETGLSMCCQVRLSEMLRRSAEMSMVTMCQKAFEQLKQIEPAAQASNEDSIMTSNPILSPNMAAVQMSDLVSALPSSPMDSPMLDVSPNVLAAEFSATGPVQGVTGSTNVADSYADIDLQPYGLPSIRELLRVLVSLLDPNDKQHTNMMRVMALRIIDVAFEVSGSTIASFPALRSLAVNDLCRHLSQLIKSDSPVLLQTSLRVSSTILHTLRPHLKLQQELILSYIISCLHLQVEIPKEPGVNPSVYEAIPHTPSVLSKSTRPGTPSSNSGASTPVQLKERQRLGLEGGQRGPDARETMVEYLSGLARMPSYMTDLFVNYDCDVERMDLCADLIGILSRNAFPDAAMWSTPNVPPLCLDALLSYVAMIEDRLDLPPIVIEGYPSQDKLLEQRNNKKRVIQGTSLFNKNPKEGIRFLVEHGIITSIEDSNAIAVFLRNTSRVGKKLLGEYLAKPSNAKILNCFIDSFDFANKRIDIALRELLGSFRLPGESQQIERILEKFSERYCEFEPKEVANKDAAFVLSYSMIMLNTDQHNPQVKHRMTFDQYKTNLRDVNDKKDFSSEYLESIYAAIRTQEIIMPEEHDTQESFEYAWKELIQKASSVESMYVCEMTNIYDKEMFRNTWRPVLATLAYVFTTATDDMVFMRVITGFDHCARIATHYGIWEVLDDIIMYLSTISTLSSEPSTNSLAESVEIQVDGSSITVSELSVRFGRNYKAQLATVVLFRVVRGNEYLVRKGWKEIIHMWLNLFANSLISPYFSDLQHQLEIPDIPTMNPANVIKKNDSKDNSLFSTLSSYLSSYAVDGPPEPSDEELESTLCAVDCVNSCGLSEVFDNISGLDSTKVTYMFETLLDEAIHLQQRRPLFARRELSESMLEDGNASGTLNGSMASLSSTASSTVSTVVNFTNPGSKLEPSKTVTTSFAPLSIYVMEMATCLVLKDTDCLVSLHEPLMDSMKAILENAENIEPVVIGRAAYYMLLLLRRMIEVFSSSGSGARIDLEQIRKVGSQVFLSIASVDQRVVRVTGSIIATGIVCCFRSCTDEMKVFLLDGLASQGFWKALETLQEFGESARLIFEIVEEATGFNDIEELIAKDEREGRPKLRLIKTSGSYQAVIELLGTFASAGSVGSDWEQRHDLRIANGRRLGRAATGSPGLITSRSNSVDGRVAGGKIDTAGATVGSGTEGGVDRRNYSTLSGGEDANVNASAGGAEEAAAGATVNRRGTAMINGKRMTAAEVNAAVAAGTYPGMIRPYAEIVERAVKAVKMINELRMHIGELVTGEVEASERWNVFWFPVLDGLQYQCLNSCREIRQQAFGSLQQTLLSPELSRTYEDFEWTAIFDAVLFPLISGLLRPEVYQSDPRGMGETRLQAASLLCKVFLYYLEQLSGWHGMLDLWLRILDMMDRLMNSSPRDNLEEAVAESIKNVLLVMSSTDYLVHPTSAKGDENKLMLWEQTWKRLDRFMPASELEGLILPKPGMEEDGGEKQERSGQPGQSELSGPSEQSGLSGQ
ncbi:uncharacterized protein V1516DRAFT_679626 [Lipomyces oligophaga]|uniref:uncharacterized protein n=1 Tax=Lipomyces oligophaga TaxID=45792 RepID=UPI0034CED66C